MKRIKTLLMTAMATLMALTLTSCDEDWGIAYTLEGTWRGNMYVSSTYNGYTYDATYTELSFVQDPYKYSSGTGYWIDHYASGAPWTYVANHTEWKVRNGVIRIHLLEEDTYVEIADYRLNDSHFDGSIHYGDTRVDFEMTHVSSPNWSSYHYGYDYWYDSYAKAAPTTRTTADTTATTAGKAVRSFRTAD